MTVNWPLKTQTKQLLMHCRNTCSPLSQHSNNKVRLLFLCFTAPASPRSISILTMSTIWTEWSAIWSEIIWVILKSDERTARVQFKIAIMISDLEKCATRSSITTLLQPFWNRRIQSVPIFHWSSIRFVEKRKQKGFYNFVFETVRFLKTELEPFRTWVTRFWSDLVCRKKI